MTSRRTTLLLYLLQLHFLSFSRALGFGAGTYFPSSMGHLVVTLKYSSLTDICVCLSHDFLIQSTYYKSRFTGTEVSFDSNTVSIVLYWCNEYIKQSIRVLLKNIPVPIKDDRWSRLSFHTFNFYKLELFQNISFYYQ